MKPEPSNFTFGTIPVSGSRKGSGRWLALVSLLLLAGLALSACGSAAAPPAPTAAAPAAASSPSAIPVVVQAHLEPMQFTSLSFLASGRVSEVLAVEGDALASGQLVARLAGSEARLAELALAKQEDLAARQAIDELKRSAAGDYAQALQAQVNAQTALEDMQRKRSYLNSVRGSKDQIAAANAGYILAQNEVDRLQGYYNNVEGRPENDPTRALALANLQNAKKARDKALINVNWYKSKPTDQDIALADANLAKAEADLKSAQELVSRMNGGPDPERLAAAQARADSAKAALASAQSALDALELRAPVAGALASLDLKAGQFMTAGQTAATLADFSTWIVKTNDLTELDVVKVKVGDTAAVSLDAFPDQPLSGTVTSISSTYQEKQGDIIYTVKIALQDTLPQLRWGMTAEVRFNDR